MLYLNKSYYFYKYITIQLKAIINLHEALKVPCRWVIGNKIPTIGGLTKVRLAGGLKINIKTKIKTKLNIQFLNADFNIKLHLL